MSRHSTVSLCMIVRNEAHQLADCLSPVADLFDDIVLVDTGSHDGTRQIAERFTPRVIDFPWCDDFSAARNEALRHARGEWIFWLDADDRVSPENVEKLRRLLLSNLNSQPRAFLMQVVLQLDPESRDRQRLVTHLRLFRKHPALRWQRRVHEQLVPWPSALGHEMVFTDIQIDHLGYRDAGLMQRKLRRNLRLLNMEFAVAPDDPALLVDLGYAYAQLGKPPEARKYLQAALHEPRCSLFLRRRSFTTLGELETALGNFEMAHQILDRASEEFPDDDYLLYLHSEALYNLAMPARAKAALLSILDRPPANALVIGAPSDLRERLVPLALGEVHRSELQLCQAERVLRGVTEKFPHDASAWWFLGRVYIDWRDWNRLTAVLSRLDAIAGGAIYADILKASSDFARSRWLAAEQTLDRLIAQVPAMILPRVLRAECLARRLAPRSDQLMACRDVLRLQPHNARALELLQRLESPIPAASDDAMLPLCTSVVLGAGVPEGVALV
jgi:glycosyltransferase involved in cell wall biosynthesis